MSGAAYLLLDHLAELGIELRHEREGTQRLPCPDCARGERDDALALTISGDGAAVWQCFRCGFNGAVHSKTECFRRPPERRQARRSDPERHENLAPRFRDSWAEYKAICAGSVAARYLEHRGCALPPIDGDLRWHPSCWHWPTQTTMPAMIGLITDIETNVPISLHFTFLKTDGSGKAGTGRDKLLLPKHRKAGGVIRLWPNESVTYSIGLAEGIESALTLAHAHAPVWSAIDAANLASMPVLNGIETAVVAADNDAVGLRAAREFANRWARTGKDVRLAIPETPGGDLNDVARAV